MKFTYKYSFLLLAGLTLSACNLETKDNASVTGVEAETSQQAKDIKNGDQYTVTTTTDNGDVVDLVVTDRNGMAILEGDIIIGNTKDILGGRSNAKKSLNKGLRIRKNEANIGRFWTNAVVPYQFAPTYAEANKTAFLEATAYIADKTPVTFVERTASNRSQYPNYIEIINSNDPGACYSYLGMTGGRQEMGLGANCRFGTIVHEIGHALGLWHEHTRSDRDNFVNIHWDNIVESRKAQFELNSLAEPFGPYDYGSIMHYPTWGFAINRWENTITPLQSGITIGQRNGLSAGDIAVITDTYGNSQPVEVITELENNIPVLGISGIRGSETRLVLGIPEGTVKNLTFLMTGGSGDGDLYVKRGSAPSLTDYDCRPYVGGNHETCRINTPQDGEYHVMIRGYSNYSGAQLTASYELEVIDPVVTLQNGIPSTPVTQFATGASDLIYKIDVPEGMGKLSISAVGNNYRGYIQLQYAQIPGINSFDCSDSGFNASCEVTNPASGTWFVVMRAFRDSNNASMLASFSKPDSSILENGSVRSAISIAQTGGVQRYSIAVPAGVRALKLTTRGPDGDADLYIKRGSRPATNNYDCRSYSGTSNEICTITNPAAGVYHVMVRAYQPFSGLTLRSVLGIL